MIKTTEIEKYFKEMNYSWDNLFDVLPIGILVFDEKWKIKTVNKNFIELLDLNIKDADLLNNSILEDTNFKETFPLLEIAQLSKGKYFEIKIENEQFGLNKINLILKGSPIFKDGKFEGGILIAEDFRVNQNELDKELSSFNSFTRFVKSICNCFLIMDNEGIIKYASFPEESNCNFLSKSEGKSISSVFNNSQTDKLNSTAEIVLTGNKPQNIKLNYNSNGEELTFNSVFIPLANKNNKANYITVLLNESNNKSNNSLEFLTSTNELSEYKSIVSANSDASFKLNLEGNIIFWTNSAKEFFGLEEKNIIQNSIENLFSNIDKNFFEKIKTQLLVNKSWSSKLKFEKGQKLFSVDVKMVLSSEKKDIVVYCNYFSESQQRFEQAKLEETQFFKNTVLKSNEMILQIDSHGTIAFVNEKFCEKFGYESDEISGVTFTELIDNKFKIENKIPNLFAVVNNKEFDVIPLISKTGDIINVCPKFNITHDGTSLKHYTVYLRECKKERKVISLIAESLLNDSKEAIIILSDDKILRANTQFLELFGFDDEAEIVDVSIYTFVSDIKKTSIADILLGNSEKIILQCKTKLDKNIEVEIKKINKSSKEKYSILLFRPTNIQSLFPAEQNNSIENLEANLNEFSWSAKIINNEINIEFISPGISKVTGYSQMNFISQPIFWQKIIHPDDLQNVKECIERLISTPDKFTDELNFRFIKKDGSTIWINNQIKIIKDENGLAIKAFGSANDVTSKVQENLKLQSEISELQTENKTKDKFISIISHDLRSPFTSILGFTELIATDTTLTKEEIIEYVSNIRDASQNTLNLVNSLLDWTRLQTGRIEITPKVVNANYLVKKTVVTLSGSAIQKGLTLTSEIDNSLYVNADENILTQVFNNLVSNSIKFTPKGGNINIEAIKLEDQQKIKFIVSDTGVGIQQENISKLFLVDKKFTTLGTDGEKGTGLGLSLVKEIIEKHSGEIYVESKLGEGTKFIFTIPISSPTILLLDNVDAERNLYSKLITSITKGIKIYQAKNLTEAEEIIKEKIPMLIITEHNLERTTGLNFIKEISNSE
ncbi:MAG: PAS domain S-box protein, partial [Melioribacteraceae bacterium]